MQKLHHHNLPKGMVYTTDLPGIAIEKHYFNKADSKLFVHDEFGPEDEMPVEMYFRKLPEMPKLEKQALKLCTGKVLDIGAGAGSHALELQRKNMDVCALEISPSACRVMAARGVKTVVCEDFFKFQSESFDTLLLLMNGIGLCANLDGFRTFLKKARTLLHGNGHLIFDSCDISYIYDEIPKPAHYFGEAVVQYSYGNLMTAPFTWLFLDKDTMQKIALEEGWNAEIICEDQNSQYLARLSQIQP